MIRWYDYIVAIIIANFMYMNILLFINSPSWITTVLSGMSVYGYYIIWVDWYGSWRYKQEHNLR